MLRLTYVWNLDNNAGETAERYCHNCGKRTVFTDSMKRRRNGNGKTTYEYAIFKCEKEHTWNKLLRSYNAHTDISCFLEEESQELFEFELPEVLSISEAKSAGAKEVEILVESVNSKLRIDKLLALQIKDISRTQIKKWIKASRILIDGQPVEADAVIRSNQRISIYL